MRATVYKKMDFCAAHKLPNYDGKCANLHGHTWYIEVGISGEIDDRTGMVVDFTLVKAMLNTLIEQSFDHHLLNDVIVNPTAENIAQYFYFYLTGRISKKNLAKDIRVEEVTIWESDDSKATVRG